MTRERLGEFLAIISSIEACEAAVKAALFLKESWSSVSNRELFCEIHRIFPIKSMRFDRETTDEEFIWQLKNTLAQSFSVFIEISRPPPHVLVLELEQLTQRRSIEIEDGSGQMCYLPLDDSVKVFSCVDRDLIEQFGSYGHFYTLFDTVFSV